MDLVFEKDKIHIWSLNNFLSVINMFEYFQAEFPSTCFLWRDTEDNIRTTISYMNNNNKFEEMLFGIYCNI